MKTVTMVYQSINYEAPNYFSSLFEKLSQTTIEEVRSTKNDLKLSLLKISSDHKYFSCRGARIWNSLSAYVKMFKPKINSKRLTKSVRNPFANFITSSFSSLFAFSYVAFAVISSIYMTVIRLFSFPFAREYANQFFNCILCPI